MNREVAGKGQNLPLIAVKGPATERRQMYELAAFHVLTNNKNGNKCALCGQPVPRTMRVN